MIAIRQGSNTPINLHFSENMSDISNIEISLHTDTKELKHWCKNDVAIDEYTIVLPLTEDETLHFTCGNATLDVKVLDSDGDIIFYDEVTVVIVYKFDKTPLIGG